MENLIEQLDPAAFVARATEFIRETVSGAGFEKVIVALSGGLDSSTTLLLVAKALGAENVHALLMPYGEMGRDGVERARLVVEQARLPEEYVHTVNIKSRVEPLLTEDMSKLRRGNIMARVRMIVLYDMAKNLNVLVAGTENKSEYLLGYFTRFGDEASDLEPIRSLYKTQVYQLAEYLRVPREIIETPPTAGLWPEQTDENELGFSYAEADPILYLLSDRNMSVNEVVSSGHNRRVVEKVAQWVEQNEFKHHLPYVFHSPEETKTEQSQRLRED